MCHLCLSFFICKNELSYKLNENTYVMHLYQCLTNAQWGVKLLHSINVWELLLITVRPPSAAWRWLSCFFYKCSHISCYFKSFTSYHQLQENVQTLSMEIKSMSPIQFPLLWLQSPASTVPLLQLHLASSSRSCSSSHLLTIKQTLSWPLIYPAQMTLALQHDSLR